MIRHLLRSLLLLTVFGVRPLFAQGDITISPPVLYPGNNVLTINAPNGLQEIRVIRQPSLVEIDGDGSMSCEKSAELRLFVTTASQPVSVQLRIIDCRGAVATPTLSLGRTWNLDTIRFRVDLEKRQCQLFRISANGIAGLGGDDIILDSVTSPDKNVTIEMPTRLPLTIPRGSTFRYRVCFNAEEVGLYQFPVITWIRREFPAGGYSTYPVADTGVVRVMEPERAPSDSDWISDPPAHDPTTFRSVAVPNAIIPAKGKFFAGVYDFLGLVAGYAPSDNLMILAGGALPTPDDWGGIRGEGFGAYSIGLKAGLPIMNKLNVAVGYQYGRSMYDREITSETESEIAFHAPYGAISYGTDSSRISATFGYVFKRHRTFIENPAGNFIEQYDRDAPILALGGDYQFANHWKIAGEIAAMKTLDVAPIVVTARYFSDNYAVDFGVGYVGLVTNGADPPSIPLLPVLSGIFVF